MRYWDGFISHEPDGFGFCSVKERRGSVFPLPLLLSKSARLIPNSNSPSRALEFRMLAYAHDP